jgi:hypothetical protein
LLYVLKGERVEGPDAAYAMVGPFHLSWDMHPSRNLTIMVQERARAVIGGSLHPFGEMTGARR